MGFPYMGDPQVLGSKGPPVKAPEGEAGYASMHFQIQRWTFQRHLKSRRDGGRAPFPRSEPVVSREATQQKQVWLVEFLEESHRIHGAGIFTYIYPKNGPVLSVNIPAPWILWEWTPIWWSFGFQILPTSSPWASCFTMGASWLTQANHPCSTRIFHYKSTLWG